MLLTASEVAEKLNVSRAWVYKHRTELGGIQLGTNMLRFPLEELEKFIQVRKSVSPALVAGVEPRGYKR